jgi:hypothetical protein
MREDLAIAALEHPGEESTRALLGTSDAVFWVDWKATGEDVVAGCEHVVRSGALATAAAADRSLDVRIVCSGKAHTVPEKDGEADLHGILRALNQLLSPRIEIRACVDSFDSDGLAFLPLPPSAWANLEASFGDAVATRFRRIEDRPDLFRDSLT